jgi:hypothetical protein
MIRRIILACILAGGFAPTARAINASAVPPKFPIPWGNSAGSSYIHSIPKTSQIGIQNGAASLTDGFPPLTFLPVGAGGAPPFGSDFNGILMQITQWAQWQAAGGPIVYDSAFSSSIGGYPLGAVLSSATPGNLWFNTVDNNTTDPDTGGAGWTSFSPIGSSARVITVSGAFTIGATDGDIGLQRTLSPAASSATLLANAPNGKKFCIQDLARNFNPYPVTITAPGGTTIGGAASVVLNINGQSGCFTYYSAQTNWSFAP